MTKTKKQLHAYRQHLMGDMAGKYTQTFNALKDAKKKLGRKLHHHEFEKIVADIKYAAN